MPFNFRLLFLEQKCNITGRVNIVSHGLSQNFRKLSTLIIGSVLIKLTFFVKCVALLET